MNSDWQQFLAASSAHVDNALVTDFGDAAAELLAARDSTVIAPLTHLGLIECAGEDAQTFLHSQLTSDIKHLDADAAQHSAWCSPKGRMLVNFLIFRSGADYQMQLSADLLPAIQKRLQMFVLRAKVKITDLSAQHELIGLAGTQAEIALQGADLPIPAQALGTISFANGKVIRLDAKRFEILVNSKVAAGLWRKLAANARAVGTPAWQWLNVQAGIPLITEATKEEFVPQMLGFEQLGGVSFNKGCYPGQEIVARTQYLGKVKRGLYRIHTAQGMTVGDSLYSPKNPEQACGALVNTAPAPGGGYAGLAVLQESCATADNLALGVPDGQRIATIEPVLF